MLCLDTCDFRLSTGLKGKQVPVLRAWTDMAASLGLQTYHNGGIQFWKYLKQIRMKTTAQFQLTFTFQVKDLPKALDLLIETPEKYKVQLNQTPLKTDVNQWLVDRCMKRLTAVHAVQKGLNTITINGTLTPETELEDIYIVGDFDVDAKTRAIIKPSSLLSIGDWTGQGLPFYGANVIYRKVISIQKKKGERIFLTLPELMHSATVVHINGSNAGIIGWQPNEVDITRYVQNGKNTIEIEVCGSRRNMMGPHHEQIMYPAWTGPNNFLHEKSNWTDQYMRVPYGIMAEPVLSYRS
jgi:hypothetical protein